MGQISPSRETVPKGDNTETSLNKDNKMRKKKDKGSFNEPVQQDGW